MKYIYNKEKFSEIGADIVPDASETALRALLWLAHAGSWDTAEIDVLAKRCGCAPSKALAALEEWQNLGIIEIMQPSVAKKTIKKVVELPEREGKEIARVIEEGELKSLIDACQQTSGHIYKPVEISVITGLYDELSLDGEYILTLLGWCVSNGIKSLRALETTAFSMVDRGIDTVDALNEYISKKEAMAGEEAWLRGLFGIGARKLSAKENACFECWIFEWKMSRELIGLAYDIAVNTTGKAPVSYIHTILKNWFGAKVETEADALAYIEKNRASKQATAKSKKPTPKKEAKSFDVDDFFAKALERSYKKD